MTLTFVLPDVEGSTRLWEAHGQAMGSALAAHDRLVPRAVVVQVCPSSSGFERWARCE